MERSIGTYMVKSPYVCDPDMGLQEALEFMLECEIRHLPVLTDGQLVGLLSERDLRAAIPLPQAEKLVVSDIMKRDVYVARRTTPLLDVVRAMQDRKLGSTIIVNNDQEVTGIFTVTDALGILADLIESDDDDKEILIDDYAEEWEWETVA